MEIAGAHIIIGAIILGSLVLGLMSWKWCLPKDRSPAIIALSVLLALVCGLLLYQAGFSWSVTFVLTGICQVGVFVGTILWLFYRDPERTVPPDPGLVVSPADGTVIYLRQLAAGEPLRSEKNGGLITLEEIRDTGFATEPLWQVGISMVYTDVHVNRAPIEGRVTLVKHTPGQFLSLRRREAVNRNERQTLMIERGAMRVMLVQIASRLVRQIVAYVKEGEIVERGQRVGVIKLGSQVDLFMPLDKVQYPCVTVGQKLRAGVTVVARLS
jgi:phosphatidylserine decarboxylase